MDKKKLKWYAILAAAAIAATLLFPIAIREGCGWIAGKILENAGLETETGEDPQMESLSGEGLTTDENTEETSGDAQAESETADRGAQGIDAETGAVQETMPDTESLPAGPETTAGTETAPQARTEPDTQTSDVPDTQAGAEPDRNAKAAVTEESDAVSAGTPSGPGGQGDTGDAQMDPASGNRTPASESVEESLQAARDAAAKELEAYIAAFQPDVTELETAPGGYAALVGDRVGKFRQAFAEYLYGRYGNILEIDRIELIELVSEDDTECTYQVRVYAEDGESDPFLCMYSKTYDFYGVYAMENTLQYE